MKNLSVLGGLLALFCFATEQTAFAEIQLVDQQNLNEEALVSGASSIFWQGFTPTATWMNTVEVVLFISGTESIQLQLSIAEGTSGPPFRSSNLVTVPPATGPILVAFTFWRPVGLTPGKLYRFALMNTARLPFAVRYGSDTYPGGNMYDYYTYPDRDIYFREGINVPPVSIMRPTNQQLRLQGIAVPSSSVPIDASSSLEANSFVPLGSADVNSNGDWQYDDPSAATVARRFYRASLP